MFDIIINSDIILVLVIYSGEIIVPASLGNFQAVGLYEHTEKNMAAPPRNAKSPEQTTV